MRKAILAGVCSMMLFGCIGAGENSAITPQEKGFFPHMTGIDLIGEDRAVPQSFAGDLNLVAIAFEREQQDLVNTWIGVADDLMKDNSQLRFYEVPLIYEMNGAYRTWVNNGMRSGIPDPVARERTITVYTDRPKFLETMSMQPDRIYVVLLNKSGKILWQTEGSSDPSKIDSLKKAIADGA